MQRLGSTIAACCAIVSLLWSVGARAQEDTWRCTGKGLSGKPYQGFVTVERGAKGGGFKVEWNLSDGKYKGIGLGGGKAFATAWFPKAGGLTLYRIGPGGTLAGRHIVMDSRSVETESFAGGTPGRLEGKYTNTELDTTTITIRKVHSEAGFTLVETRWDCDMCETPGIGVGIAKGEWLAVAMGVGKGWGVILQDAKGESFSGVYGMPGKKAFATQVWTEDAGH